jgi:hypothetical protein
MALAILLATSFSNTVGNIESTVKFLTQAASVCAAITACFSVI